jgi:hypothetical protein
VRRLLIAVASVLCGAALVASGPAALAADSSAPTLTLTPAAGPPGTHVTISGKLTAAQIPVWAPMLNTTGIFELGRDPLIPPTGRTAQAVPRPAGSQTQRVTACGKLIALGVVSNVITYRKPAR